MWFCQLIQKSIDFLHVIKENALFSDLNLQKLGPNIDSTVTYSVLIANNKHDVFRFQPQTSFLGVHYSDIYKIQIVWCRELSWTGKSEFILYAWSPFILNKIDLQFFWFLSSSILAV